jgi:hypothetical protein
MRRNIDLLGKASAALSVKTVVGAVHVAGTACMAFVLLQYLNALLQRMLAWGTAVRLSCLSRFEGKMERGRCHEGFNPVASLKQQLSA